MRNFPFMKNILGIILILISFSANTQVAENLAAAMKEFNSDEQLQFAMASLYVVEANSGEVVFDQNSQIGMAPASTEKIVTAATALEVLGKNYRYQTKVNLLTANGKNYLYIQPSGDPTLGSWRWEDTKELVFLNKIKEALIKKGIKRLEAVIIEGKDSDYDRIPDGWIWEDVGNYYGAAALSLNWRENQFDVILKSGAKIGDAVSVVKTEPHQYDYKIVSKATAAAKESGDNSYLYYPSLGRNNGLLVGTIPLGNNSFKISGSMYDPKHQFVQTIIHHLKGQVVVQSNAMCSNVPPAATTEVLFVQESPELSSIVYWFLRKSINLYGEALLRSIALKEKKSADPEQGIEYMSHFWSSRGIHQEELHVYDGSGLSPQNRITANAQVKVLQYAKTQSWYKEFLEGMPLYNEMKMKSGTINRVKGYTGYHTSKNGKEYIFSMLINNYHGSEYALVRKMYRVLDNLK